MEEWNIRYKSEEQSRGGGERMNGTYKVQVRGAE